MKLTRLECPNCSAGIDIDVKGKNNIFCPYCGTQFFVDNGNINININHKYERTEHITNDAKIAKEKVKLEKERNRHKEEITSSIRLFIPLILCIAGMMGALFIDYLKDRDDRRSGVARVEVRANSSYEGRSYESVVNELKALGFENIETVDLDDAGIFGIFKKEDTVEKITINGESDFYTGERFPTDARVVIMYH